MFYYLFLFIVTDCTNLLDIKMERILTEFVMRLDYMNAISYMGFELKILLIILLIFDYIVINY
jgi:hypothetical protein